MNAMTVILLIVAILGVAYWYKKRPVKEIDIPAPAKLRTDLYYGYYGCEVGPDVEGRLQNQPLETKSHVNFFWEAQFNTPEDTVNNILFMKLPTILDVTNNAFSRTTTSGRSFTCRPDAEVLLTELFKRLQDAGALKYVVGICPVDEPNINTTEGELRKAIGVIETVAARFSDLSGFKFTWAYAAMPETYDCIDKVHWVATNDYEKLNTIFDGADGAYNKLVRQLKPHQRTFIIPGGAFGQNPEPFVNFAHSHPEVIAIVPFCWFGRREKADTWIGIGNPLNGRMQQYIEAGLKICNNFKP